tara:strand:+ start:1115 stop:2875 length:1761 start_codon:yes stop_codon:yes gene_type:complete
LINSNLTLWRFFVLALAITFHPSFELSAQKEKEVVEEKNSDGESENDEEDNLDVGDSILRDIGFDPLSDSFIENIKSLLFSQNQLDEVSQLIIDLDSDDFRKRNEASKKLAMHESPIGHLLVNLDEEPSIEMSRRIQAILNVRSKKRYTDVLYHVLGSDLVDFKNLDLDSLLVTSSTFDPKIYRKLFRAMEGAAVRCASKDDVSKLIKELENSSPSRRQISAFVLGSMGKGIEVNEPLVIFANLRGKMLHSDNFNIEGLIDSLDSADLNVRHESARLLKLFFKRDFGFAAYDSNELRQKSILLWRKHIKEKDFNQAKADWSRVKASESYRVIVGKGSSKGGKYNLFTTSGTKSENDALVSSLSGSTSGQLTFDYFSGNFVVSGGPKLGGAISVFSFDGTPLWSVNGMSVSSGAALLDNGQIISTSGSKATIMDVLGRTLKTWEFSSPVNGFHGLSQHRFLCAHADEGKVAEYNSNGELIWSLDGLNKPKSAYRYQNGNLSVVLDLEKKKTDTEEIIAEVELVEFSPDGKEVISTIQPRGVKTITSSVKLPNGNTLIGTEKGLAEYTPGGYAIKVWLKTPITTLHVH